MTPAGAFPAGGASVTICTSTATGTPCTPKVTVYSDSALSLPVANPLAQCTAPLQFGCLDNFGNVYFYATPGNYSYSVTGAGLLSYGPIPLQLPCVVGLSCVSTSAANNFTGPNSFSQPITSTVATGTAPLIVTSTTQVANLNAQLHGGLAAPGSAIVGLTDIQTLTNKTLTGPTVTNPSTTGTDSGAESLSNKTLTSPVINGASTGTGVQGTDSALLTSGTVSASTGVALCTDANHGATTSGCTPGGVPEMVWSMPATTSGTLTLTNSVCTSALNVACQYTFLPSAHKLVRLTFQLVVSPTTCATQPQVGLVDITGSTTVSQISIANASSTGFVDSGALNVAMTAGHEFALGITVAESGCGTAGSINGLTAVLQ